MSFMRWIDFCTVSAEPALIDVELTAAFGFFFDGILRLALGSDKQEARTVHRFLSHEFDCFFEKPLGFLKINNVNSVALSEDVLFHLRVPPLDLVAEMDASLKQFFHRYRSQSFLLENSNWFMCSPARAPIVLLAVETTNYESRQWIQFSAVSFQFSVMAYSPSV
jgi:hypothetical protein